MYHTVIGSTEKGRLLAVVWIDHQLGRFPVHAPQAGRRAARRYYRLKAARNWVDPFDEVSDDEFDAQVDQLFSARPGSVAVWLRIAPHLLGRVKRQAARAGVPYQTFMKSILEAAVSRLERRRELKTPARKASLRR